VLILVILAVVAARPPTGGDQVETSGQLSHSQSTGVEPGPDTTNGQAVEPGGGPPSSLEAALGSGSVSAANTATGREDSGSPPVSGSAGASSTSGSANASSTMMTVPRATINTGPVPTEPSTMIVTGSAAVTGPVVSSPLDSRPIELPPAVWPPTLPSAVALLFVSPSSGQTIDLETNHTFEVRPVAGAAAYVFTGSQFGRQILTVAQSGPSFTLVGSTQAKPPALGVQAGKLTITVVASDNSGRSLGQGSITVMVVDPSPITLPPVSVTRPTYSSR
jgi:hypothetical protein